MCKIIFTICIFVSSLIFSQEKKNVTAHIALPRTLYIFAMHTAAAASARAHKATLAERVSVVLLGSDTALLLAAAAVADLREAQHQHDDSHAHAHG